MSKCTYCGRERSYVCRSTRDMEDFAESGDRECFYQLAKLGGGEKGLKYVIANCEAREKGVADAERRAVIDTGAINQT